MMSLTSQMLLECKLLQMSGAQFGQTLLSTLSNIRRTSSMKASHARVLDESYGTMGRQNTEVCRLRLETAGDSGHIAQPRLLWLSQNSGSCARHSRPQGCTHTTPHAITSTRLHATRWHASSVAPHKRLADAGFKRQAYAHDSPR